MTTINAVFNGVEGFDLFINETLIVEGSNDVPFSGNYVDFRVEVQDGWEIGENFTASITFKTDDGAGGGSNEVYEVKYSDSEWNEEKTVHEGNVYVPSYMIPANTTFTFTNFIATEVGSSEPIGIANLLASIYNPTNEQLFQFSQDRYKVVGAGETGSIIEVIDMGNYISELYVIPFDLYSIRGTEKPVVIGGDILDVSMCELTGNLLTVEMGPIEVVPKYGNAYDYLNTVCYIVLPFTPKKELDVARIMGKIVTVSYVINLFTGEATCNISADDELDHELIDSFNIEIVDRIPFKHSENQVIGFTSSNKLHNNIENPYIEIVRNIPYNESGSMGMNVEEYIQLSEIDGYVEISKIDLIGSATKREKQEIERLLASGVFIKTEVEPVDPDPEEPDPEEPDPEEPDPEEPDPEEPDPEEPINLVAYPLNFLKESGVTDFRLESIYEDKNLPIGNYEISFDYKVIDNKGVTYFNVTLSSSPRITMFLDGISEGSFKREFTVNSNGVLRIEGNYRLSTIQFNNISIVEVI